MNIATQKTKKKQAAVKFTLRKGKGTANRKYDEPFEHKMPIYKDMRLVTGVNNSVAKIRS